MVLRIPVVLTFGIRTGPRAYDIYLEPEGDGSTTLRWEQEITALNENGDRLVAAQRQEDFSTLIGNIERMLEHYLKTGEALDIEH